MDIPEVLQSYVDSGDLSLKQAMVINAYPPALSRLAEDSISVSRAWRVAKDAIIAKLRTKEGLPAQHHARYSKAIIAAIEERLGKSKMVLDPMAGTLERLSCLEKPNRGYHLVWGVEYEPEWAEGYEHDRLIQGNAMKLPFSDNFFDAIVVSPSFGNRDADRTGEWWDNASRKTYAAALGRNVGKMSLCLPWTDPRYIIGHAVAWSEAVRVLKYSGLFFLNIKNHIRQGVIQPVSQAHRNILRDMLLLSELDDTAVPTRGRHSGENDSVRAEAVDKLYVLVKSNTDSNKAAIQVRKHMKKEWKNRG